MPSAEKVVIIGASGYAVDVSAAGVLSTSAGGGSGGDVNLTQVATVAVAAGAGAVTAGTQRTTLASDDPAVTALQLIDDTVGTKAAGTAATKALLTGGVYNTVLPSPTNGQQVALQLSATGLLLNADAAVLAAVVASTLTAAQLNPLGSTSVATLTSVNSAATSAQLLAANAARKGVIMVNTDANPVYIKYGTTATAAIGGYTLIIPAGSAWSMDMPIYSGRIDGIWSVDGSGGVSITEL